MTGQFLQRKIWSFSSLPPLTPLSLLFSVYPTWYHSVTSPLGSFFHHPLISFLPVLAVLLVLYIPPVMFHSSISIHLHVALLILSHLLPSALIPPVSLPALPEPFPHAFPFPPTLSVSLILPDSFPPCYPFHSSHSPCLCHIHCHPSLPYSPTISISHLSSYFFFDLPIGFFTIFSSHLKT